MEGTAREIASSLISSRYAKLLLLSSYCHIGQLLPKEPRPASSVLFWAALSQPRIRPHGEPPRALPALHAPKNRGPTVL